MASNLQVSPRPRVMESGQKPKEKHPHPLEALLFYGAPAGLFWLVNAVMTIGEMVFSEGKLLSAS